MLCPKVQSILKSKNIHTGKTSKDKNGSTGYRLLGHKRLQYREEQSEDQYQGYFGEFKSQWYQNISVDNPRFPLG